MERCICAEAYILDHCPLKLLALKINPPTKDMTFVLVSDTSLKNRF